MRSTALFIASIAIAFVQAAAAQDVPSRVGRLAYTQGSVSVFQDQDIGWDKGYVNTPITSENSVWTDRGARAEMRVGGTAVRLDGETQLDVSRLEENELDAGVQRGSINVRVRYKERDDRITFSTPHALFMLETDGRYRIDVDDERDESRLTVFGGYGYMESASGRIPVEPGRTVVVNGGSGQYAFERGRENSFDKWAGVRDQQWLDSNSRRYVSHEMTGYEELDRYGSWSQDADYGAVWYPTRVASGWAPYRDGHWTHVRPWGWTWVDDQPWGYAPSHYGRWVQVRDRWGWAPGRVREAPVWAPALVGWIGGSGISIGISAGSSPVGWYPLAPWERYDPWYRTNNTYLTRMNRIVVDRQPRWYTGRGDDWRRWNRDRAATVVNRDVFVNRRAVQGSMLRVSPEMIRQAPVVTAAQVQQALPQRNELLRFREANRTNVAAPTVMRERAQRQQQPQATPGVVITTQPQQQQQATGQVVRPEFRRRGAAPVAVTPAPGVQQPPQISAPAPVQPEPRAAQRPGSAPAMENPTARREAPGQQRDRAAVEAQQQQRLQAETQERRERAAREAAQSTRELQERAAREGQQRQQQQQQQQQEQQRQSREAQQQQERAAREAQQQQERAAGQQRQQQEQAQRGAREQQERAQREAQGREAQAREQQQRETQQRQAREAQQQQERAAREAQQQQQRGAEAQRQQQERAAREAQQQQQQQRGAEAQRQQQERAARQPAPQQPQQAQPQQAQPQQAQPQQPQANPAGRGDRGRARSQEEKDKEEKEKKDKR